MYGFLQARASKNPKRNQDDRRPVVLRDEWRATHPRKPKNRQQDASEGQVEEDV